ncbi:phenylacetyl-CoA ligase [Metarhizium album ARSEF 1941]|uniref:Phenylacetyl-CoA ligase n=1 Tax=Metarhizium album (strain ARSEF 1941) TaxID=1081103 RepID=A0A0B2WM41_METAS|nr:phenylacetyl-CoA ligase [Metarhizium album ARSEF 1941]KHN95018.1 phenylacetyl-CoA ligase [Metarhizium album ARSEF 1941]
MPFYPPSWVPQLPEIPDSISLETFMFDKRYGRHPVHQSRAPFTDGLTGRAYSILDVKERVDFLSRALSKELSFKTQQGSEWDKVVACFSLNCIDYLTLAWAVHRLGGILTCVNASYNAGELRFQLKDSGAKAVFTCLPLLKTTMEAVEGIGIPRLRIFLHELASSITSGLCNPGLQTTDDLIRAGAKLPSFKPADSDWRKGDGAKRIAFLCYSSGTSGLPKGVMISHRNVIANTIQFVVHGMPNREAIKKQLGGGDYTESCLGLLPMSHIYGLVVVCHVGPYRGDGVVVLPRYDFKLLLQTIQDFKIEMLYLVPPMILHMTKQADIVKQFDMSSVRAAFTGAAPLREDTAKDFLRVLPNVVLLQGYGLTETSTVVCKTVPEDIYLGGSGSLLPGYVARIVTPEGEEVEEYNKTGELWVHSPSVVVGYLNNKKATDETFVIADDGLRYMRTGDEALVMKSQEGNEHIFITDRIKELIKVKGHQVAPAELEGHLLTHPAVNDCAVIAVPAEREGEVPKAFVVKKPGVKGVDGDIIESIKKHVADHKSDYKRLRGGVEFVDAVPRNPSGKILRRLIRDTELAKAKRGQAKI